MSDSYYNSYDDDKYSDILLKKEFKIDIKKKSKYVYQDPIQLILKNYISNFTPYDNILLYHQLGSGKCHAINTPILMYDGTIKMVQDIKVGDYLMGDDSTPRKVLSLATGRDKMYDIIPKKGESYRVNEEHILCLKASGLPSIRKNDRPNCRNYNIQYIENNTFKSKSFSLDKEIDAIKFVNTITWDQIMEISIKDYLKLSNTKKNILKGYKVSINFDEIKLPFDPYMLGYWIGDGSERDPVNLDITCQDSTVLHYFYKNVALYNLTLNHQSQYSYRISGSGKKNDNIFLNTLKNLNLINNKHIPHIYKCNSRENRLKLLAGLLDSDGHLDKNKYVYEFTQSIKNEQIIDDIIYLCRSLGFACYKNKKQTSWTYKGEKKHDSAWRICISGTGIEEIPVLCKRKKANPRQQNKNVLVTGIKIKYVNEDNYYGFTLDGNCRYLMGDFTVTHNTCSAITIAEGFKNYMMNIDKKIIVLVKNQNIEKNFINELMSQCTMGAYEALDDDETQNKLRRNINKTYDIITYGSFVNRVLGSREIAGFNNEKKMNRTEHSNPIQNLNNSVIIIDEVHNITNNDAYHALVKVLKNSFNYRLILLTATPMYDNSKEIAEINNLLNIKDSSKILPIRNALTKSKYMSVVDNTESQLKTQIVSITESGKKKLKDGMKGKVSYISANIETYPERIDIGTPLLNIPGSKEIVECEMSEYQYNVYLNALKNDQNEENKHDNLNEDILLANENLNEQNQGENVKSSGLYKNSSDASTMTYPEGLYGKDGFQILNTNDTFLERRYLQKYSNKLVTLLDNIKKSKGNVFIYSNYVNNGGVSLLAKVLSKNGYTKYTKGGNSRNSYIIYDDHMSSESRDKLRKIFNSTENKDGKLIKIIIGSPVISEGITLKNVRQVHILEPSWNMSKINQIIGRAIRNHSHDDLPKDERNVEIYKYTSIAPKKYQDSKKLMIDKEKYILSEYKDRSNKVIERILKEISFDCFINKERNMDYNNKFLDGSAECDYQKCFYECAYVPPPGITSTIELDKSTYNINIQNFEKYAISFVKNQIRLLYKQYFIWNLQDIIKKIKEADDTISIEVIYFVLNDIVSNKYMLNDMYNRKGFIIIKGDYYIFNPENADINSTIYSKMFDFIFDVNNLTYKSYAQKSDKSDSTIKEQTTKKKITTVKTINANNIEQPKLSDKDKQDNNTIKTSYKIYGSYRSYKNTKEYPDGYYDQIFRIIDTRNESNEEQTDKRKNITGQKCTTIKRYNIVDIIKYIQKNENNNDIEMINYNIDKKLNVDDYCKFLENFFKNNNRILK